MNPLDLAKELSAKFIELSNEVDALEDDLIDLVRDLSEEERAELGQFVDQLGEGT